MQEIYQKTRNRQKGKKQTRRRETDKKAINKQGKKQARSQQTYKKARNIQKDKK